VVFLLFLSGVVNFKQNHASFLKIIVELSATLTSLPGPISCTHFFHVSIKISSINSYQFGCFVNFVLNWIRNKHVTHKSVAFSLFFSVNKGIWVDCECVIIDLLKSAKRLFLLAVKHHKILHGLQMPIVVYNWNIWENIIAILAFFKLYFTLFVIDVLDK